MNDDDEAEKLAQQQHDEDAADHDRNYDPGFLAGQQWARQQTPDRLKRWMEDKRHARSCTEALIGTGVVVPQECQRPASGSVLGDPIGTGGAWALGFCDGAASVAPM